MAGARPRPGLHGCCCPQLRDFSELLSFVFFFAIVEESDCCEQNFLHSENFSAVANPNPLVYFYMFFYSLYFCEFVTFSRAELTILCDDGNIHICAM